MLQFILKSQTFAQSLFINIIKTTAVLLNDFNNSNSESIQFIKFIKLYASLDYKSESEAVINVSLN